MEKKKEINVFKSVLIRFGNPVLKFISAIFLAGFVISPFSINNSQFDWDPDVNVVRIKENASDSQYKCYINSNRKAGRIKVIYMAYSIGEKNVFVKADEGSGLDTNIFKDSINSLFVSFGRSIDDKYEFPFYLENQLEDVMQELNFIVVDNNDIIESLIYIVQLDNEGKVKETVTLDSFDIGMGENQQKKEKVKKIHENCNTGKEKFETYWEKLSKKQLEYIRIAKQNSLRSP